MASVMNNFCIDKIDNIRAEFPLLEANLPSYLFLSMDLSHLHAIVPILQHIVNLCLTTGDFPISCKSSIVIP